MQGSNTRQSRFYENELSHGFILQNTSSGGINADTSMMQEKITPNALYNVDEICVKHQTKQKYCIKRSCFTCYRIGYE